MASFEFLVFSWWNPVKVGDFLSPFQGFFVLGNDSIPRVALGLPWATIYSPFRADVEPRPLRHCSGQAGLN